MVRTLIAGVVLLAVLGRPGVASDPDERAALRRLRTAFKEMKLPSVRAFEKRIESDLPSGIVIESAPFDRLVKKLAEPYEENLRERQDVLEALAAHPSVGTGKKIRDAFAVFDDERAALVKAVAAVEAQYGEVFAVGYLDAGESARRTRKTAAVLIPLFRRLLFAEETVVGQAARTLAAFRDEDSRAWLVEESAKARSPRFRAAAARALAAIGGEDARAAVEARVRGDDSPAVRRAALAALMRFPFRAVSETVVAALTDEAWSVRALAIRLVVAADYGAATGPLIDALEREDGRLIDDIDDALFALTGVRMYGDVALWKKWWAENGEKIGKRSRERAEAGDYDHPVESWEFPAEAGEEVVRKGASTTFYGIATRSKRVLYVVDISRSMESAAEASPTATGSDGNPYESPRGGAKLDVAKWQLHRAVHSLPEDAEFNIVVYSESYHEWMPEMTEAGAKAKAKAHRFIEGLRANGTTNICDSLDEAAEIAGLSPPADGDEAAGLRVDTLFLLSDGNPNRGRISDLGALLEDFLARNSTARLVVHTVGIGEAAGSSFLKELAARTGGRYIGFR